jgi:hypothetical protein
MAIKDFKSLKEITKEDLKFLKEIAKEKPEKDEVRILDSIWSALKNMSLDYDVYTFDHTRVSPDVEKQIEKAEPLIREWLEKYGEKVKEVV